MGAERGQEPEAFTLTEIVLYCFSFLSVDMSVPLFKKSTVVNQDGKIIGYFSLFLFLYLLFKKKM